MNGRRSTDSAGMAFVHDETCNNSTCILTLTGGCETTMANEDWTAACSSEIFRNFVKISLAADLEKKKQDEEEARRVEEMRESMCNPIKSNLDYGKDSYGSTVPAEIEDTTGDRMDTGGMLAEEEDRMDYPMVSSAFDIDAFNDRLIVEANAFLDEQLECERLDKIAASLGIPADLEDGE